MSLPRTPAPTPACPECEQTEAVRRLADQGQPETHRCARCELNFHRGRASG